MPRLAITKRVSLADVADGWQDCVALITVLTYLERAKLIDEKPEFKTETDATNYMLGIVKAHLVSGNVKALDDKNEVVDADLTKDDLDTGSQALVETLFNAIMGVSEDPKGSSTSTETSSIPAPSSGQ